MGQASRGRRIRRITSKRQNSPNYSHRAVGVHTLTPKLTRVEASKPWLLLAVVLGGVGAGIAGVAFLPGMRDQALARTAFLPMGLLLLATGSIPFVIGVVRLLEQPPQTVNHCGRCKFYVSHTTQYASGLCGYGRAHVTLRESSCESFTFSERAMVRDRFAEATHTLNGIPQE